MSNGFPCPNPSCTHVFPADAVKGVATVNCPRCGTAFQFRNSTPQRDRANTPPPVGRPVPGRTPPASPRVSPETPRPPFIPPQSGVAPRSVPPLAPPPPAASPPVPPRPVPPAGAPPAVPRVAAAAPELAFDDEPPARSSRIRKKPRRGSRGSGGRVFVGIFIFLLLGGLAVGGFYLLRDYLPLDDNDAERGAQEKQGNFAISVPRPWRTDADLRMKFRANVAASRTQPVGHFVMAFRDYRTRLPGDAELFDNALKRLRGAFRQVEYINPFNEPNKGRNSELGGEPALVFTFSATDASEVPLRGECHLVARRGYAYWLFFWAPEEFSEQLADEYAAIRERFKLYNGREGWKPRPRETTPYTSPNLAFRLDYAKEVWRCEPNPQDADAKAELLLRGFEPTEDEETGQTRVIANAGKSAEVMVLHLDRAKTLADGVKEAHEHVRKHLMVAFPDAKMAPALERNQKVPVVSKQVGDFTGQVDRVRIQLGDDEKFGLIAVTNRPQGLLVVYGECRWERRDYWEQEFKALVESLKPIRQAP